MIKLFDRFKEAYKAKIISFDYELFAETLYKFNFLLINSASDINTEIGEEIVNKIRESQDLVISAYEEKNEINNKRYLLICLERMMIIIDETNLRLIDKYLKAYYDHTVLFLSQSGEIFQEHIKIDYSIETEKNKDFINSLYENFKRIQMKKKDEMIDEFWNIIKECLLKYLLKKNYHLTFSKRGEKFNLNEGNAHEKKGMKKEECIELKSINSTPTSLIKLFYNLREDILFIGKIIFDAQEYSKLQEREICNLSQISHPFLPKFYGIFNHLQMNTIAIEFISGCTLQNFIKPEVRYEKRMKIIIEIMFVLEYLHDHKFIYRDLKPNNVMIDSNGTVVLIDFDRMIRSDVAITGTYTFSLYTAPDEIYTIKSDIYSLGLTIFFIMTGKNPTKKGNDESEFNFEDIPEEFKKIKDICYKCTKTNPESRPSITELIVEFYIDYYKFYKKELFDSILVPLSKLENPRSQCELGILHYEGKSIQKDDCKAFQLLCLSANQNYPKAQHYIGRMYYEGNRFFIKNDSIAYQYFSLSSSEYLQSKDFCELIEQNLKTIDISFQSLPLEIQSQIHHTGNPILKKIYSSFQFHYLSLYEINSEKYTYSEQMLKNYILNTLKQFKLITYRFMNAIEKQIFSFYFFSKKRECSKSDVDTIICTEGNCFLIECIDKYLITDVLDLTKSTLINLSDDPFGFNKDELEEIENFTTSLDIPHSLKFMCSPIIAYMIRRYFYPSYFFKDPSFFIFKPDSQNNEIEIKKKLENLIFSKRGNQNEADYQSIQSEVYNDINENEYQNNIYTFQEQDFIVLRTFHSSSEVNHCLVMHKESLFIFMMKMIDNQTKYEKEISFCSKYSHRCFTKFYGFVKNNENIVGFVYEFMSNGNLEDYLKNSPYEITPIYVHTSMNRIFQGIDYLHSHSLAHSNLNLKNIFVDHNFLPFISDFNSIESKEKEASNIHSFCHIIQFLCDIYLRKHRNYEMLDKIYQLCNDNKENKQIQYTDVKEILMIELKSSDILIDCEKNYEELIQYIYENIIISHSTSILLYLDPIIPFISSKPNYSLPPPLDNKKITIPQFTKTVEQREYEGCIYIEEIIFEIPSSITSIDTSAFESCSSLIKIILPPSLKIIKECAFKGCSSLTQITIPPSVTTIEPYAFYQCQKLVEITIPLNIACIYYSAFEMCQSLMHLNIPRIKEIKSSTYNNCSSLKEITIPSSVISIGNAAFLGCSSL